MSVTFKGAMGRKVISRASAEELGKVSGYLLAPGQQAIAAIIIGRGRKAHLADWENVISFGADAVMVSDDAAVREPAGDHETDGCRGKLDMIGKRALAETGDELGEVTDVIFDPGSGAVLSLTVGDRDVPAGAVLGFGSYAAVISAGYETPALSS